MMLIGLGWREKRLRSIGRRLTYFDLHKPDPETLDFSSPDIDNYLFGKQRTSFLFMNYYSRRGMAEALEKYGTLGRLRDRGFTPKLFLRRLTDDRHMLRVRDGIAGALLIELVCRFASLSVRETHNQLKKDARLELVAIEWLLLQNPRAEFTKKKPQLPGQKYPGLGMGHEALTLLEIMTGRLEREGLLAIPEHYHNGLIYDRRFRFYAPQREGELRALQRDLTGLSLAEASWAVHEGLVRNAQTGKPYQWQGEEMILPRSERLQEYFHSDYYQETAQAAEKARNFTCDEKALAKLTATLTTTFNSKS